ncbi:MAG: phospholipid carrier-dependent glycosyltransferase [Anaerolineales bacterium]|nr:phospholipid carrier-dependent glycosyltransferase [Anaerolineales bacterium]
MSVGPREAASGARRSFPATRWLGVVIGAHLVLGLLYDWATPSYEASDEGAHYAVVNWLADGRPLPVQQPGGPERDWAQEGSQPPLYYWLAAQLIRGLDRTDYAAQRVEFPLSAIGTPGTDHNANLYRHPMEPGPLAGTLLAIKVVRLFSLTLSAATVGLTFVLAQQALRAEHSVSLLAAALVAFNPMALFINASVNNDNLLMLLSTAGLVATLALMRGVGRTRAGWQLRATLGVILGLAALTKISGLLLWPLAGAALVWAELAGDGRSGIQRAPKTPAALVRSAWPVVFQLMAVYALALLVCGWWYWRNLQLYGEWLGLETMVAVAGPRPATTLAALLWNEWYGFYLSFWGVFGVFTVLPAAWVHGLYAALTGAAMFGGLLACLRRPVRVSADLALLGAFCLLTLAGVIRWTLQTYASQGRLLFGAIAPLSILLAAGLFSLARPVLRPRAGRGWASGFVLTLAAALALVAAVIPAAYIAPHYAPPPIVSEAGLPADLRPVQATFGGQIELLGYTAQSEPIAPGDTLSVTLYWRGSQPIAADYSLALHVLGRGQTEEVGKLDTWPGGGNAATSQWTPGTIYADTYALPIAVNAQVPTQLWLDVYFRQGETGRLPIVTPQGASAQAVRLWAGRAAPRAAHTDEPEQPSLAQFENGLRLLGYDASANGALYLTLYWELAANEPLGQDYTVFLHLTDAQGVLVLEPADAPPLDGDWPTSAWLPGRQVADTHVIGLSPTLRAGRYNLRMGLYDPSTGARLAAFRPDGTRWPDDAIVLEGIVVR